MNDRDAIAVCNFANSNVNSDANSDANFDANSNANEKNKGTFDNEVLIDISGLRNSFGLSILSTNDGSQNPFEFTVGSDTNDDNNEIGIGNFSDKKLDPRYLEYVMDDQCWSDICMTTSSSGKVVGDACKNNCSTNLGVGYKRTFGGSQINYNDNMADAGFKRVHSKNGIIYVPWSDLYNNIVPANPSIR